MSQGKFLKIRTHRGGFDIAPEQIAGCKPCVLEQNGQVIQATEILISLGAIPGPPHEVMRWLADELEKLTRPQLVIPIVGKGQADVT